MSDEGVKSRFVMCRPNPEDPSIVEARHRANCLVGIFPKCQTCNNRVFKLAFNVPETKTEVVQCPRWKMPADRMKGVAPETYVPTELATCSEMPFEFCPSCPAKEKLAEMFVDKEAIGWYTRWERFKRDAEEHE